MLTIAHAGQPIVPHDLWGAWTVEPLLIGGLALAALVYRRGFTGSPRTRWRAYCFAGALVAIVVALVSPLDALSGSLASAHMVQHVLLILIAAPLLAVSGPSSTLLRGAPREFARAGGRWRSRLRWLHHSALRNPVYVWLAHVLTLWLWHSAALYGAALDSHPLHVAEHLTFVVTAWLFWRVVISARLGERVPAGLGVLLVFGMAMQSVFLSVLLTFAESAWYPGYATTTAAWGLTHLGDQQLAGVIMWVPAGLIYLGVALMLMATWLRSIEEADTQPIRA